MFSGRRKAKILAVLAAWALSAGAAWCQESVLTGIVTREDAPGNSESETLSTLTGQVTDTSNSTRFVIWSVATYRGYVMNPPPVYTTSPSHHQCQGHSW